MKKIFYWRYVCFKCTDFFVLSEENENGDTDAEWKYTYIVLLFYHYNTQHNKENEQNSVCSISDEHLIDKKGISKRSTLSSSEVRRLPCVVI